MVCTLRTNLKRTALLMTEAKYDKACQANATVRKIHCVLMGAISGIQTPTFLLSRAILV